ncbi:ParA family protein [Anaerospora hongkongensis]|uniref:ParA family protein n=1 Tax=Anaerospora hongkongensis TaxID=244830 RepID=UPI002FDAED36
MQTIAFINLKGGPGKTTIATNTACYLAEKLGTTVLFVDNDKQGNASQFFGAQTERTLADILLQKATTAEVIQKTRYENIDIIAADMCLAAANLALLNQEEEQHNILARAFAPIQTSYDFCIIDNPPDINLSVLNALIVTDEMIVVSNPDEYSLQGIKEMEPQIELARQYNPNLVYRGCLINKMSGTSTSYHYRDKIRQSHPVFKTNLRYTRDWLDATTLHKVSIFELSPRCAFAQDLKKFIEELLYIN